MNKDLVTSNLHRQNVLNNSVALKHIESDLNLGGIQFKGETVFTKSQITTIFNVDERTIDRIISDNHNELSSNGYRILRSTELNEFKDLFHVDDKNVVDINPKIPQLGLFRFKTFLNIAMLITNNDKAKSIRSKILDTVMQVITQAGDRTYVNQRDADYLPSAFQEENYRKEFTSAINQYIEGNQWKYKHCTDAVYKAIFKERADEYRKIINMKSKGNVRDTFYSELLLLVSCFEAGLAEELKKQFDILKRQLTLLEAKTLIENFGQQAVLKPHIQDVRTKIASRDLSLRDALHEKLQNYIQAMPEADYEKFLGEKSKDLQEHIDESLEVYKRLKDR